MKICDKAHSFEVGVCLPCELTTLRSDLAAALELHKGLLAVEQGGHALCRENKEAQWRRAEQAESALSQARQSATDWASRCGETQAQLEKVADKLEAAEQREKVLQENLAAAEDQITIEAGCCLEAQESTKQVKHRATEYENLYLSYKESVATIAGYAEHKDFCSVGMYHKAPCSCGLKAAIAAASEVGS